MNRYFHSCVLVALAVSLTGCGENPSDPVAAVETGGIKPAEAQTDTKISLNLTTLDSTSELPDHKRIQGSWTFVTFTTEHKDHVVFSGDKFSWHVGEKTLEGTFVLDAMKQPKQIDLTFQGEKDVAGEHLGIYDFRSDMLLICLRESGGLRPTKLDAAVGQQMILIFDRSKQENGLEN